MKNSASFLVKIKKLLLSIFIVILALVSVCLVFVLGLIALVYLNVYCHIEFAKPDYPASLEKMLPLNEIEIIDSGYHFYSASNNHGLYFIIKLKNPKKLDDFLEKVNLMDPTFHPERIGYSSMEDETISYKEFARMPRIIYHNYFLILTDYATKSHRAEYYVKIVSSVDKQFLYLEMESWN